jgi:preprotein translocase subunit SecE
MGDLMKISAGVIRKDNMFGKIVGFFSESRQELAKANWPTRDELLGSTVLVIVVTLLTAAFIFAIDLVLSTLMRFVIR